jgi:hypothetical protein
MARLGVALLVWACYLEVIEASPSGAVTHLLGGEFYENRSSVLRGVGVCGGSLDL